MLHHAANLWVQSWHVFTGSLGTTTLGFFTQPLVSLIIAGVTLWIIFHRRGMNAVKEHIQESITTTLWVGGVSLGLVYGSLFVWSVISAISIDHGYFVTKTNELSNRLNARDATIAGLKNELEKKPKAIIVERPASPIGGSQIRAFSTTNIQRSGVPQMDYMLTTNTPRTPVDLIATCDFPIVDAIFSILTESGGTIQNELGRSISPMRYQITIYSPAWTVSDPIKITLFFANPVNRMPQCSFSPR